MVSPLERLIAEQAAALAQSGADAVVLSGSFSRGDAHHLSDIDLTPLSDDASAGPPHRVEQHGDRMFVFSWRTPSAVRSSYRDPAQLGAAVPAWRRATALYDPQGIAAELIEEAQRWSWNTVSEAVDAYVADGLVGLAEEVYKVVAGIVFDERRMSAVNRAVLALQLAHLVALRRGLLWDTENVLWDLVVDELGEEWAIDQDAALGLGDASTAEQTRAALTLYEPTDRFRAGRPLRRRVRCRGAARRRARRASGRGRAPGAASRFGRRPS